MAATGSINLAGLMKLAKANGVDSVAISQIVPELEVKGLDATIPAGGDLTSLPLGLSTGVTEALFLAIYSPTTLTIELTSSDGTRPGPFRQGLKSWYFATLAPGQGIVALSALNEDPDDDVTLVYYVGAKRNATDDTPSFWT
jgi:hypothetical protein